jgi:hypothetical protein
LTTKYWSSSFLCGLASSKPVFIRPAHINAALRDTARHVYNIKDEEALSSFSSHSIRVGAYVALRAAGISNGYHVALRWKSDTFLHILAQLAALTPQLCISTRTSLLSFPPLALPKYGTLACTNCPFFPFFAMFLFISLLTISALNAPILRPNARPLQQFYPATSHPLYWRSCFQIILNRFKHVVRQHVRALNACVSAPPLPLIILFYALTSKGQPNSLYSGTHEVPSTQC